MKVLVIYGGESSEREVSLKTGQGVYEALKRKGYKTELFDYRRELILELVDKIIHTDIIYIALHGRDGEDGKLQALIDLLNKPYVGSNLSASSLAMNKFLTKQVVSTVGIPTAKSIKISSENNINEKIIEILEEFSFPLVVKPNREGSSFGFSLVKNSSELEEAIYTALHYDTEILVEDYLKGREFTVSIIEKEGKAFALPVIEIIPKNEYYDYESKYSTGGSLHVCPAEISKTLEEELKEYAIRAYSLIGCKDYSRIDFIVDENRNAFLLEVNTLPGMTPTSLLPDAAKKFGYDFDSLVEHLICLEIGHIK